LAGIIINLLPVVKQRPKADEKFSASPKIWSPDQIISTEGEEKADLITNQIK
jgi:hypothetical protein